MGFRNPITTAEDPVARAAAAAAQSTANEALTEIIPGSRLAADAIDGMTITGATIRTAAPGSPRIELSTHFAETAEFFTGDAQEQIPGQIYVDVDDTNPGSPASDAPFILIRPPVIGAKTIVVPALNLTGPSRDGTDPGGWTLFGAGHFTGAVTVQDPTVAANPATKGYVDAALASAPISPAFANGWANFNAAYKPWRIWLGPDGKTVHSEGLIANPAPIANGGTSSVITTIPVGYRPSLIALLGVLVNGGTSGRLDISPSGAVDLVNNTGFTIGAGSYISMHFTYRAD